MSRFINKYRTIESLEDIAVSLSVRDIYNLVVIFESTGQGEKYFMVI